MPFGYFVEMGRGRPGHDLPSGGHVDNELPSGGHPSNELPSPPPGVWPPPTVSHPIIPAPPNVPPGTIWPPPTVSQPLPPLSPGAPDQGLPPEQGSPSHPIASNKVWVVVWIPGYDWAYMCVDPSLVIGGGLPAQPPAHVSGQPIPGQPARPGQALPPAPQPRR